MDILKTASLDTQTRMQYEEREKTLKDIASIRGDGVRKGRQEGIKEEKGRQISSGLYLIKIKSKKSP